MSKKALIVSLFIFVPFSFANAQEKEQGSGPSPYTECGIGAALFSNTAWAAATSNVIWDLGITAVISATASPETCSAKKVETARLILETLPSLEQDVALGDGEYLASLHETMGCDSEVQEDLNMQIRSSYSEIISDSAYGSKTRIEKAEDMYGSVKAAVETSAENCAVVL